MTKEEDRQRNARYRADHKEERRRYSAEYYAKLKRDMLYNLGYECSCCGSTFHLTLDHVTPVLGRRGSNTRSLLDARDSGWDRTQYQVLCGSCNQNKSHGNCDHTALRILYGGE